MKMLLVQIFLLQLVFATNGSGDIKAGEEDEVMDKLKELEEKNDNIIKMLEQFWGDFLKKSSFTKLKGGVKKKFKELKKSGNKQEEKLKKTDFSKRRKRVKAELDKEHS